MGGRFLALLAAVAVAAVPALASAAEAVSYVILKEGKPIGHEKVSIDRQGDVTTVQVDTESKVTVVFLDFHYRHHRVETWRDGKLERMVADTDDDGSVHHLEAVRSDGKVRLTVDGTTRDAAADVLPLTLWGKAILTHPSLYSIIDAEPYKVSIASLGAQSLTQGGKEQPSEHYRITGDVDRDLWYGNDGLLIKVAFERRGYPIEIVRE
ncbi:MAG: hypothetical protein F8N37_00085 [Telmatospirillum sp.]|nr:hypothetical protein [Telmatospirillum sp.]